MSNIHVNGFPLGLLKNVPMHPVDMYLAQRSLKPLPTLWNMWLVMRPTTLPTPLICPIAMYIRVRYHKACLVIHRDLSNPCPRVRASRRASADTMPMPLNCPYHMYSVVYRYYHIPVINSNI
jgi:hypothetical protein